MHPAESPFLSAMKTPMPPTGWYAAHRIRINSVQSSMSFADMLSGTNEIKHAARVLSRYRDARRTRILRIRLRLTVRVNKKRAAVTRLSDIYSACIYLSASGNFLFVNFMRIYQYCNRNYYSNHKCSHHCSK